MTWIFDGSLGSSGGFGSGLGMLSRKATQLSLPLRFSTRTSGRST